MIQSTENAKSRKVMQNKLCRTDKRLEQYEHFSQLRLRKGKGISALRREGKIKVNRQEKKNI